MSENQIKDKDDQGSPPETPEYTPGKFNGEIDINQLIRRLDDENEDKLVITNLLIFAELNQIKANLGALNNNFAAVAQGYLTELQNKGLIKLAAPGGLLSRPGS